MIKYLCLLFLLSLTSCVEKAEAEACASACRPAGVLRISIFKCECK